LSTTHSERSSRRFTRINADLI